MFLDKAKIFLSSGIGGNGCVSFRREKYIEFGGPDGGSGGKGGNIIFKSSNRMNTLSFFRYQQHFKAKKGCHGMGKNMTGKSGEDLIIEIPIGTQIWDEENENMLFDITKNNQEILFLEGGRGGLGNTGLKSSVNRAPKTAINGADNEEMWVWLRMKLIADIGIIGLPNAGKSTLLSKITNANPKIANYPFTTLHPQLGVIQREDKEVIIADLPGLIEGAAEGKGLGHKFLGHIERCKVLLHIIDITSPDPMRDYQTVRKEMMHYMPSICEKKEIIAFSKCDLITEEEIKKLNFNLDNTNTMFISSIAMQGIKKLCNILIEMF